MWSSSMRQVTFSLCVSPVRATSLSRLVHGRVGHDLAGEACRLARVRAEIGVEAEEADQRVVVFVPAHAGGHSDVGRDVEGHFAERRVVEILSVLHGQPQRIGPAGDVEPVELVAHDVALLDAMGLALEEQAGDPAQAAVARRRQRHFMAVLGEVILAAG